jgi:hypothetical protein
MMGLLALLAVASARGAEASPLDDLIAPKAGNSACFTRLYDAAHLRRHPKQQVKAITVRLKYDPPHGAGDGITLELGLSVSRQGDPLPWFAQGDCAWREHASRDVSDKPLLKQFTKAAGADCTIYARPDVFDVLSAEEGGYLIIDRGKDGNTLMLYLDDGLTMVKRADRAKQVGIAFGTDDRVFLLRRGGAAACAAVKDALTR